MPAEAPLFSVVIPAYKCANFIGLTLQSVYQQTETDFEIVVVNDGSPDNTLEVLQRETDPRLRIINQENGGECAARNRGVREARGTYVAFLDSDDAWLPDHLALARKFFEAHHEYDWYSTKPKKISAITPEILKESEEKFDGYWAVNWFLEGDGQTSSTSSVLKRAAIGNQDLFPMGVKMYGDNIGWCRFAMQHRMMGTCYRTTALYRIWGGSATGAFQSCIKNHHAQAGLEAFLLHKEMASAPDCPVEARLFFRQISLYNWWLRARAASLRPWKAEIKIRQSETGRFISKWLTCCIYISHFFTLAMGKIVRISYNRTIHRQKRMAMNTRRKLNQSNISPV